MSQIPCKDRTFRREDQIFFAKKLIFEQNGYFFVLCTIFKYIDTFNVLAIDIPTQVRSLVNNQALLTLLVSKMCECGSEQAGTYNQVVVFFISHNLFI